MPFKKLLFSIQENKFDIVDIGDYKIGFFCGKKNNAERNDDVLLIQEDGDRILLSIADGAGGHPKGDEAAKLAIEEVQKCFSKAPHNYLDAIENANDKVNELRAQAHSTLILGNIVADKVRFYTVGDSEILYWNASGNLLYSNIPQSVVGHAIESGHITQTESLDHDNRHIVNNMLGDHAIRIETTSRFEIKKGHTILLGSDGLFDNVNHDTLTDFLSGGNFQESFQALVDHIGTRNTDQWIKDDDISFIVLRRMRNEK